jgi:hypothetical protein
LAVANYHEFLFVLIFSEILADSISVPDSFCSQESRRNFAPSEDKNFAL